MSEILLPAALAEIVDEFRGASREEKLELLLGYADAFPDLPERIAAQRGAMEQVHECMTPVSVIAERDGDGLGFFFDVPPESPTVRGYAELLRQGLVGATAEQVLAVPDDLAERMQLGTALTPRRINGVRFMLAHVKRQAVRFLG